MRTSLYQKHVALGAKIVTFSGWEMPLSYQSIIQEHLIVRKHVGLFDVSHMGKIIIKGSDAEAFLDYLSTNHILHKPDGSVTYTVWCYPNGGSVDDLLVYRKNSQEFFVVVNAGNEEKDYNHALQIAKQGCFNVEVSLAPSTEGILAIQGPQAFPLVQKIFPQASAIKAMHFAELIYVVDGVEEVIVLSRTGYTGSDGFEIYASPQATNALWDLFLCEGKEYGIAPIGLGARDTLRLEKGYALYGCEISDSIAPTESVCRWTVKWDKHFIGKEACQILEKNPRKRVEYGVVLLDAGIVREGYVVSKDNISIGFVTSGTFSPSLNKAIGIILVEEGSISLGSIIDIQIRRNHVKAQVVSLPFIS